MSEEQDEKFDDDWWDQLAIDPITDTHLQALELKAQVPVSTRSESTGLKDQYEPLEAKLHELQALHAKQQELIDTLTRQTQQQQGEIAVVRANWKRAQEQNAGLQQKQSQLELEYHERFERIQQENQRQIEKLETSAAFRRIEQDTNRTPWPSSLRRRAPVMLAEPSTTKATLATALPTTPTRSRMIHYGPSPSSSHKSVSPLSSSSRKRPNPSEQASPSRTRAAKMPTLSTKKEFPRFVNSFLPTPRTNVTTPTLPSVSKSPPTTPSQATQSSSPATPQVQRDATVSSLSLASPDAATLVLTTLFCYRSRWATQVMAQPFVAPPPPNCIPGTNYFPLGAGNHQWSSTFDSVEAQNTIQTANGLESPMLLRLLSLELPEKIPFVIRQRFTTACKKLWEFVTRSSSYNIFLAESGHIVDDALREEDQSSSLAIDIVVARVWKIQARSLFGTVAAALRSLTGIFLRLNWIHYVTAMLNWITALGISHTGFVKFYTEGMQYLDHKDTESWQPLRNDMVPSSQDDAELLPSSPGSAKQLDTSSAPLLTPNNLVKIWIECLSKTHIVPLDVSSPSSQPEKHAQDLPAWDIGGVCRASLLCAVLASMKVLAWTAGVESLPELRPLVQHPGMLLTLLDAHSCSSDLLLGSIELLMLLIPDPTTLHMALSSPYDAKLQPRVAVRLQQVRFPVVDILAKYLVDRRGDTPVATMHHTHQAILLFISCAARHEDTLVVFSESMPLLPALIQCLSWDTEEIWVGSIASQQAESALERVCLTTRLLHQLYAPESNAGRGLAEKLLSPQTQTVLNGIRHAFIVAMGRIAFAQEPTWLSRRAGHDQEQSQSRMRSQLENAAMLAGDLIDLVLSPSETDEIYELLTDSSV
ncbi:hypothetical protein MYAM1_000491 [Malassezia yamatoensis]|uniref:Uncharacterized protein n=1 Tax=Malassezia yamatoensis TaxID=253288 RepID=A0AAJ5YQ56_9BASI|nr:hypothetical protein MYAM1_000491 [Malassezia yamatoensis]